MRARTGCLWRRRRSFVSHHALKIHHIRSQDCRRSLLAGSGKAPLATSSQEPTISRRFPQVTTAAFRASTAAAPTVQPAAVVGCPVARAPGWSRFRGNWGGGRTNNGGGGRAVTWSKEEGGTRGLLQEAGAPVMQRGTGRHWRGRGGGGGGAARYGRAHVKEFSRARQAPPVSAVSASTAAATHATAAPNPSSGGPSASASGAWKKCPQVRVRSGVCERFRRHFTPGMILTPARPHATHAVPPSASEIGVQRCRLEWSRVVRGVPRWLQKASCS